MTFPLQPTTRTRRTPALALALLAGVAALSGCRGERSDAPPHQFLPDMDDQQKFRPQTQTAFFADGRIMRPVVDGAVPFGRSTDAAEPKRDLFLHADQAFSTGTGPDGKYLDYIPDSAIQQFTTGAEGKQGAMLAMIKRGQERFNIYCSACHGYQGEGATQLSSDNPTGAGGMVGRRWAAVVPSYHDPKYLDRGQDTGKDGYIFHTAREGVYDVDAATNTRKYRMPPYGHAVTETDAWAIVAYVRTLQASWTTDLAAIPADKKSALDKKVRPPAPKVVAPAPAAAPVAKPGAPATPPAPASAAPAAPKKEAGQ